MSFDVAMAPRQSIATVGSLVGAIHGVPVKGGGEAVSASGWRGILNTK